MVDYPYMTKTSTIADFLDHLQSAGVPEKVDRTYLDSTGFTSSSDRPIVGVLEFIGFVESSGKPTPSWQQYKARAMARKVLGKAILTAYADLFKTYPDAPRKDLEALMDFFRSKSGLGDRAVSAMVNTFKELCARAEFEGLEEVVTGDETPAGGKTTPKRGTSFPGAPSVSINIQLQLPATENEEIYDKLFAALRKHLYIEPEREK